MPGPVSDSYDPEFGTGDNAETVRAGIDDVRTRVTEAIGTEDLENIVEICDWARTRYLPIKLDERDLRIIRFCLDRALESI